MLVGQKTIFNGNRRHPPRANPILVTVFMQRDQVRYQFHDINPSPSDWEDPTSIWTDTGRHADWWEDNFTDRDNLRNVEPVVVLYRLRVRFHA